MQFAYKIINDKIVTWSNEKPGTPLFAALAFPGTPVGTTSPLLLRRQQFFAPSLLLVFVWDYFSLLLAFFWDYFSLLSAFFWDYFSVAFGLVFFRLFFVFSLFQLLHHSINIFFSFFFHCNFFSRRDMHNPRLDL